MIDGVEVKELRVIPDERGSLMEILRKDDEIFQQFGQVYMTTTYPNVVKAWHYHKIQTDNVTVVKGMLKLVLYDPREGSPTKGELQELFVGEDNYVLVKIPPRIWNGFKGTGVKPAIVANCATLPHDPDEISRLDPVDNHIPYDWSLKHG